MLLPRYLHVHMLVHIIRSLERATQHVKGGCYGASREPACSGDDRATADVFPDQRSLSLLRAGVRCPALRACRHARRRLAAYRERRADLRGLATAVARLRGEFVRAA